MEEMKKEGGKNISRDRYESVWSLLEIEEKA